MVLVQKVQASYEKTRFELQRQSLGECFYRELAMSARL